MRSEERLIGTQSDACAMDVTFVRGGGGCIIPGENCMNTRRPVTDFLREKHPIMCVPPVEIPMHVTFSDYKDYEEVPKKRCP